MALIISEFRVCYIQVGVAEPTWSIFANHPLGLISLSKPGRPGFKSRGPDMQFNIGE
jgi:hypothetical protein